MKLYRALLSVLVLLLSVDAYATRLLGVDLVDKDYLAVHFRDGEVRYRDNGTGPSAYLGHAFAPGDD